MKRWIAILLAGMMALHLFAAVGEEEGLEFLDDGEEIVEFDSDFEDETPSDGALYEDRTNWVAYDYDHLTVGNPTRMSGMFFTELWGNNTSDIDVRRLVDGYSLAEWDGELSLFRFDHSVVSGAVIGNDEDGNRRYLISIYSDLYYSDGTPITAWDYAFSVLFQSSPLIEKLGGTPANFDFLEGYEEYRSGSSKELAGLRVINDRQIVFVVKQESLPYFFELARFNISPYPIHAIAPGCRVLDSEQGAYIGNADPAVSEPVFTEALLRQTVLAPQTGYLSHPAPNSGPYTILSFDGETAEFALNRFYKGDEDGKKPHIKQLTYTWCHNDTMIDMLAAGEFGLLNKTTLAQTILDGMSLCNEQSQFTRGTYPRTGLTYFYFVPDSPLVQGLNTRMALAYCFDKTEFIRQYAGNFAMEVNGLYGLGQWMYQLATGVMGYPMEELENPTEEEQAAYDEALLKWESISLDGLATYPINLDRAAELLDQDGWNLNPQGQPFDPDKDTQRCRLEGDELQPLTLTVAYSDALEIQQPLTAFFKENLERLGIQTVLAPSNIAYLEEVFNGTETAAYDLIYLGNNFTAAFNPRAIFSVGEKLYREGDAPDSLPAVHAELKVMAQEMDRTEPDDVLSYMEKWVAFQTQISKTLPVIPVYTNVYFDFYTRELHDYWITDQPTWSDAIVPARMYDADPLTDEEVVRISDDYDIAHGTKEADFTALNGVRANRDAEGFGGALAGFPKEIQDQIPKEYRFINEFVTASLSADYENVKESTIQFAFETLYPAGETVYLIFGVTEAGRTDWFTEEAEVTENGSVRVTLDKDQLDRLSDQPFPLVVISKE